MTPATLAHIGVLLFGRGWQTPLAAALGVTLRTVVYWAAGAVPVPRRIIPQLEEMLEARAREIEAARLSLAQHGLKPR